MIWLVYCWRNCLEDDDPHFLTKIEELARQAEASGAEVRIERMDLTIGKRLRDQMIDKIFELKSLSNLAVSDGCIFAVPRALLSGEEFQEETAYALTQGDNYPKGTFPCTALMYV